ncbi:protein RodZ, contains Xre-like HTH and DUF4115 domains [Lentibacillus persicus]|uniref:Protein RodZ, contains Xre-like HTH and DUF4115 domains n=1 Tax=Lentibacillus persicus TaxID=640948 RepID=A0A1I1V813_9BACI|nr:RodZ domain-containing protein [Lentibacillus persicus]SFD79136.1 protein RodZ, contains Xre-like HTH and DUF4115 domains [Lentibacillus persicus]
MGIGERLKEARVEQNMSLESLQETTKIQKRYLEAIEQENFKILPGTFYARAFIKEYAAAVGLDPNGILEEYQEDLPQSEETNAAQYAHIQRSRKDERPRKTPSIFSFFPTVIVVLLIIGIIFVVWYFYQGSVGEDNTEPATTQEDNEVIRDSGNGSQEEEQADENAAEDEENTSQSENSDEAGNASEQPEPEFVVEEEGAGEAPESTLTLENASSNTKATITASGESWLEVENGEGESLESTMITAENSPIEVDLSEADRVWFKVGNAPVIDISIDGISLEYPVDAEEEVFQKIWVNINQADE